MAAARTVAVLGAGRMGVALYAALRARAVPVRRAAARAFLASPRRREARPCTWVLAVRDGQLDAAARALAPVLRRGDVVLHLAGMLGPEALAPARASGAHVASMHPLCAVAAGNRGAETLARAAFTFEGDRGARPEARRIARSLGGTLIEAASVDRARYHGAAALVATGAVALAQGAAALLAASVTPTPSERAQRAAVRSLLVSVASNVEAVGARAALASPLLRDDTRTVARHLDAMASHPAAQELYRAAIALVVDALEAGALVRPETVAEARRLTRR
jgi:predicted short-subunit dehydrogenase-like oxidoreductase (DUF2520 family)